MRSTKIQYILLLALAMLMPIAAVAQKAEVWDGVEVTEPYSGTGTSEDPYIITNGAMLKWIQVQESGRWNKCYKLMADIDLGGNVLGPIGYGLHDNESTANHHPFTGTFDGNGFAIKNLALSFDDIDEYSTTTGLFGYVRGATIRNIILDNVTLVNTVEHNKAFDVKLGCLTGVASPQTAGDGTQIENIIVKNTTISDGGAPMKLRSYMIGGAIGDITYAFGGYKNITSAYGKLNIKNIYVDADFSLNASSRFGPNTSHSMQVNIGGILGRARRPNLDVLPDYTFYTGAVRAPIATVSPVWGMVRSNGTDTYLSVSNAYAGEVISTLTTTNTGEFTVLSANEINIYGKDYVLDAHRLYSGYQVYDSETDEYVEFTDLYPRVDASNNIWLNGTRTLASQKGTDNSNSLNDHRNETRVWRRWQGVNHAKYVQPANANDSIVGMFNSYRASNHTAKLLEWTHDSANGVYFKDRPGLELERTGFDRFVATVSRTADYSGYKVLWTALTDDTRTEVSFAGLTSTINPDGTSEVTIPDHIDSYYSITANLVPADAASADSRVTWRTAGIPDPEIRVVRSGECSFTATMVSMYPEPRYKYKWYAVDADDNETYLDISAAACSEDTYTFGSVTDVPKKIKAVLCYDSGNEICSDSHEPVNIVIPVTNLTAEDAPACTIVAEKRTVGRQSYIVVKVLDADGNQIAGGYDKDYLFEPNITYRWEVNADPSDVRGWKEVNIGSPRNSWLPAYTSEMYYRITWQYNLQDMSTTVYGSNVIFVYRKDITADARPKGYTTFDGLDRWTDEGGVEQTAEYPDGDDANDGSDPYHAVASLTRAYSLCTDSKSFADNIIVIMGYYQNPDERYLSIEDNGTWARCATLTGKFGSTISGGALVVYGAGEAHATLKASTCFENLNLCKYDRTLGDANEGAFTKDEWKSVTGADTETVAITRRNSYTNRLYITCDYHDFKIGENVIMYNYDKVGNNEKLGMLSQNAPHVHIVAGPFNAKVQEIAEVDDNAVPGVTTLTFQSGHYARIISCARNTDNGSAFRVLGTLDRPCRTDILINIPADNSNPNNYTYDIGLIVGGQTDGTVFADNKIEVNNGRIGRFISGSISYGRDLGRNVPIDSFFGSTEITLKGGEIEELYGGSLGRYDYGRDESYKVKPYFYGRSIINIDGGRVKSDIYGAGSGGISGVGDDTYHTSDEYIPYTDANNSLYYGNYEAARGNVAKLTLRDGTVLDFNHTYNVVNIMSGTVDGNIYGGGCGYSQEINWRRAIPLVGDLYGDCFVNISQNTSRPTVIYGNVYGGGAGDDTYYRRTGVAEYGALARVFGDTHVSVTGGTIYGDVFGGAKGLKGMPEMAVVYGNTNLEINNDAIIDGNIFGGCDFASVRKIHYTDGSPSKGGDTNLTISGSSIIGNNIFGGNRGEVGMRIAERVDTTSVTYTGDKYYSRIEGNTNVAIHDGTYIDTPWLDEGHTQYRTFNIYGGGYNNCHVLGSTNLDITRSPLKSTESIGTDFIKYWNDLTHRRFCVYGGGYGEDTDVKTATNVNVNIESMDVIVRPDDGIDFYLGKQFFDVAGGGYSGPVEEANVTIDGNSFIRKVIGGGFFGSVRTNTNTHLRSGIIFSAFGGCMMGYVHEQARMTIGTRTDDGSSDPRNSTLWITENVYGGNDVQGIIGATMYSNSGSASLLDPGSPDYNPYDPAVLYVADVDPANNRGVFLNIYGGRIMGSVYGAGNGYYRGYYVPGFGRYAEGPARFYRQVPSRNGGDPEPKYIYKTRPTVGRVNLNIQGNNEFDKVQIDSMVFGAGRCCTIGQWNPEMQVEDPRRLRTETAGHLNVNFGSHVDVGKAIYLGARGRFFGLQTTVPKEMRRTDNGQPFTLDDVMHLPPGEVPNEYLDAMGPCAYDHWYYDGDAKTYKLGFPEPGKMYENPFAPHAGQNPLDPDKKYFLTGEHQFYGFLKFIEMASEINLTFYDNPYTGDPYASAGNFKVTPDNPDDRVSGTGRFDAADITTCTFFLGGERGFMTYQPQVATPTTDDIYAYDILLPEGVTIKDKVVGGCENSWIKFYPYKEGMTEVDYEAGPMYQLLGGLSSQSDFGDGKCPRVKVVDGKVYADIRPGTRTSDYAIRLSVLANFDPQLGDDAEDPVTGTVNPYKRFGGLIYGGCYQSGITEGDVVLNIGANLLGNSDIYHPEDPRAFGEISSMKYNVGRVYGGGFGEDTEIHGNTYVYLLNSFTGFNVFGGGMKGVVTGQTNVSYIGNSNSYIYGAIYGGSLLADVGSYTEAGGVKVPDTDDFGSKVALYTGNVDHVYGGSCLGNVYGGSYVYICNNRDENAPQMKHVDWNAINHSDWGDARLVVGTVYGGNDIAGHIVTLPERQPLSTRIWMNEQTQPIFGDKLPLSPGRHEISEGVWYSGFPLVGSIYGGSNAEYGTHDEANTSYLPGSTVTLATGVNTRTETIDLNARGYVVPNIDDTRIDINGGTIINLYGGGNSSTVRRHVQLNVNYTDTVARAGFNTKAEADLMWNVMHLTEDEQFSEVLRTTEGDSQVFERQIFRTFGGNDNCDMAIQPRWDLRRGHIGSVYSGGNVGRMTYYNPTPDPADPYTAHKGLSITVDSKDIRIEAVYGGGRIGNIEALDAAGNNVVFTDEDDYGATVNIRNGIIEAVFGGNDVAGLVRNGTNVNISGAISGDVYGAGNGNYLYKYDRTGQYTRITEEYTDLGRRYFVLPKKAEYDTDGADATRDAALTVLAINSYRPNVDRAYLNLEGSAADHVWVKGNVYCGGNSSTISSQYAADYAALGVEPLNDIRFNIGSHVTLNGVFMGSNGRDLVDGENIHDLELLNGVNMTTGNTLAEAELTDYDKVVAGNEMYPKLFDLYMRAVDVTNLPKDFQFPDNLTDAYIGEFYVGGNNGSMLTDKKIELTFPRELIIYGKIVGGCKQATVTYNTVTHEGGLTQPLAEGAQKVHLIVKSQFRPLELKYPAVNMDPPIVLHNNFVDADGKSIYIADPSGNYIEDPAFKGRKYFADGVCNVFGGCYTSGTVVGDILVDLYSDMLDYGTATPNTKGDGIIDKQAIVNGVDDFSWRTFSVIGGGYGHGSKVYGYIGVRMLPEKSGETVYHPSAASIFGGSQEGLVVGNATVEIRDGKILANVYGASESAEFYGSTHVLVGYPKYYRNKEPGIYSINRTDYMSKTATEGKKRNNGEFTVPKTVAYQRNGMVPDNVREMIIGRVDDSAVSAPGFQLGQYVEDADNVIIDPKTPESYLQYFSEEQAAPADYGVTWDDIEIWIGDQSHETNPNAPYYGHGNVYGGGFIPANASQSLAGKLTVLRYTDEHHPKGLDNYANYGGNTCVLVWDNPENADLAYTVGGKATKTVDGTTVGSGTTVKDHISIGTGRYVKVAFKSGLSHMGLYTKDNSGYYHYQTSGRMVEGNEYFRKEADGGIYGGGRMVFAQGFRSIDLAYYGYAEASPQRPKLLNTLQHSDVVTVTDCCIDLVGATDFTTDLNSTEYGTLFAINRVGELRMTSSLDRDKPLARGEKDNEDSGIIKHDTPRSRNYIGFYHNTNHLAAFRSNWSMEGKYHLADGSVSTKAVDPNEEKRGRYASDGLESYVLHKHDIIERYDYLMNHQDEFAPEEKEDEKAEIINNFNQRNVGTSANMIGINSGYALRFEGLTLDKDGDTEESIYYGPAYGVTEIKLLTVTQGEGGGYVFALNHHFDKNVDNYKNGVETQGWMSEFGQDFMITTGNFVFPGAAYMTLSQDNQKNYNYISDDCEPMGYGYYGHRQAWESSQASGAPRSRDGGEEFNVNDVEEIHHWFINGSTYIYNVSITGITSDDDRNFYLNSGDDVVNLVTVEPGATIRVKEVLWYAHTDADAEPDPNDPSVMLPPAAYDCDLADMDKAYKLFFSVGHDTHNNLQPLNDVGTYVTEIPRRDYTVEVDPVSGTETVTNATAGTAGYADPNVDGNATTYKRCAEHVVEKDNIPRLGIRLEDKQPNRLADQDFSVGREYYDKHLKDPHKVQVVIESQNPPVANSVGVLVEQPVFTYIINLDINYLLGPMLKGQIDIENCALPGEYIYVNANNVKVDMDNDNLSVNRQFWRLYPNNEKGERLTDAHGKEIFTDLDLDEYAVGKNERLLHLPAYYYQNDWEVVYGVNVSGFDLEAHNPRVQDPEYPDDPDKTIPAEGTRLHIHNYHRMRAFDGTRQHDLKLTPGARIYIEDDDDIEEFFRYVDRMQYDPSYDVADHTAIDGDVIDPQYCEGLDFFMQTNVNLPTTDKISFDHEHLLFKGTFHGNGHIMHILDNTSVPIENGGYIYNTGFVSEVNNDRTKIYKDNTNGHIINCYYYNSHNVGTLADNGYLENCYQNTSVNPVFDNTLDLLKLRSETFLYGQVAYNLNEFYLKKRDLLLRAGAPNTFESLTAMDVEKREDDAYAIEYIENMFRNGDYQYALWRSKNQFAEALRTSDKPNYLDMLGKHEKGESPTQHDTSHPHDPLRWCENHQRNHPVYSEDDYLFFGQELSPAADARNEIDRLPTQFTPETRVYRISGFYGSKIDRGYFLNKDLYLHSDRLTAIDLTGFRDKEPENIAKLNQLRSDPGWNGWMIASRDNVDQDIYYAPTIDMSLTQTAAADVKPVVIADNVSRNVLIYGSEMDHIYDQFHYQDAGTGMPVTDNGMASYDNSGIWGHHIIVEDHLDGTGKVDYTTARVYGGAMSVVDCEPFNAPKGFEYDRLWYNRTPKGFANGTEGKSAWEGIYLPFTVDKVYAASTSVNVGRDHGEVSHFYGEPNDPANNVTGHQTLHEYWLRRMTGADATGKKLTFERPMAANETALVSGRVGHTAKEDSIAKYSYTNTFFWDVYKDLEYVDSHNAYATEHSFENYRYLSGAVPYIITFPGVKYREFDMTGEFYSQTIPGESNPAQQTICYMAKPNSVCPTTDDLGTITYKVGNFTFAGTFGKITVDDAKYMVIDEYEDGGADGSKFVRPSLGHVIMPFRTYVTYDGDTSKPMQICGRAIEGNVEEGDDVQQPDEPEDYDDGFSHIEIEVDADNCLIVRSPYATDLPLFNTQGQHLRTLHIAEGENRYTDLTRGFYVLYDTKFYIR